MYMLYNQDKLSADATCYVRFARWHTVNYGRVKIIDMPT